MNNGRNSKETSASGPRRLDSEEFEMPFAVGDIVAGKYEVTGLLGVGGVGFVVAATHLELGEKVALKFLQPDMLENPQVVGRFSQEALASVKIKSEHVARVFDVGNLPDGAPYIVIEHLEGQNLDDILREQGPMPIRRVIDYVMQACEALADAHSCGVVHRDVKPENLFLVSRTQGIDLIKVLDFGISKVALTGSAVEPRVPLVKTMLPVGSPLYMSPEQVRASSDIDARTDIWSLGCVLYELLSGRAAFDAPSITEVSARILEQEPTPLRTLRPDVPAEVEAVVVRCLQKDPDKRYGNVAELALALYPFGPRRARISAERCCLLLNVAETSFSDFELPSMAGPSPLPPGSAPVQKRVVNSSDWPTLSLRSKPAERRKLKTGPVLLWAGIAVALILGAVLVLRLRSTSTPVASSIQPSELSSADVGTRSVVVGQKAPAASAVVPAPVDAEPSAAEASAPPSPTRESTPAVKPQAPTRVPVRSTRPKQGESAKSTATPTSNDPDPGF